MGFYERLEKVLQKGTAEPASKLLDIKKLHEEYDLLANMLALQSKAHKLAKFDAERENFVIKPLGNYTFVVVPKDDHDKTGDKTPYYCAHCFENSERNLLQFKERETHRISALECPGCHALVKIFHKETKFDIMTVPVKSKWDGLI